MNRPDDIQPEDWDSMPLFKKVMFCAKEVSAGFCAPDHIATAEEIRNRAMFVSSWATQEDPSGRVVLAFLDEQGGITTWATTASAA